MVESKLILRKRVMTQSHVMERNMMLTTAFNRSLVKLNCFFVHSQTVIQSANLEGDVFIFVQHKVLTP